MKWKKLEAIPKKIQKKNGLRAKPQLWENILILDIYTDKVWEARYCIDTETGEHGYRREGEGWKQGKLITCIGGNPMDSYIYYGSNYIDLHDLKFESKEEEEEASRALGGKWSRDWRDKVEYMEMGYDREKRWEKESRKNNKRREMMGQIPELPEGIREWIYEKSATEEYAFFNKAKGTWGCTCCGAEVTDKKMKRLTDGGKVRHNDKVKCPKCGKTLVAKKRTKRMQKKEGLYLISELNEEASVIRYVDVFIEWMYGRRTVMLDEAIRIIAYKIGVNPRRKYTVELFYDNGYGDFVKGNQQQKKAKKGYLYPGAFKSALENTAYEDGIRVLEQFAAAGKHLNYNSVLIGVGKFKNYEKILEYLHKGRFERLLEETVDQTNWWGGYMGILNLNVWTPFVTLEMAFGIQDRQKINRIREENGGEGMVLWMRYSEECGKKVPKETLDYLLENEIIPEDIPMDIGDRMSPQKIQNYIEKQRAAGYQYLTPKEVLEQWADYLSMCKAQDKNMDDELVYRPRDLKLRHDQEVADQNQLRIVQEMSRNKKFREEEAKKMREKYPQAEEILRDIRERYEYANEEYTILVPKDLVEIIEEGQALHHCAGATERYFDRIESRETYICFLRRTETPKIPFYTIEVEPSGTIRQHRSYMDEEPGIELIRGFLKEWQKALKKRLTEEDKRLAKVSKVKREENIAELREKNNTRVLKGLAEDFMESVLDFEEAV